MVRPDEISGFINNRWFDSLAGMGKWFGYIALSAIILGAIYLLYLMIEHKVKVTWFPVYGINPGEVKDIKTAEDLNDRDGIVIGQPKKDRGREVKIKGVQRFSLLKARKKIQPIDYTLRYPDGIWMLRISKDLFVPIKRPDIGNSIDLEMPHHDLDLWEESAEAEIRRRTQDEDLMKKQVYLTVAIIIGAFVLAGIIIWLSMTFAGNSINNALDKVAPLTENLQKLTQTGGPG